MNEVCACNSNSNGIEPKEVTIDASGKDRFGRPIDYRTINNRIRKAVAGGAIRIMVEGVMGQRYIGSAACQSQLYIGIRGTPGNNLGAFLNGPTIEVFGNAQDMTGNTMSAGRIIVHGNAWDVTGLAARGGRILVEGNSGYRVGIHMKEFGEARPTVIIGGRAGDYLGEYMAGGTILVLGQGVDGDASPVGLNIGAGIHGGSIFIRGRVEEHQLGTGAAIKEITDGDRTMLEEMVTDFERTFGTAVSHDWSGYTKIAPLSSRPFRGYFDPTNI